MGASYTNTAAPLPGTSFRSRQSQISHHKVEIVSGPAPCDGKDCANNSVVVYAEGKLDDTHAIDENNAEYWSLEQDFPLKQHRSCPIGNLKSARLSIGGGSYVSTRPIHEEAFCTIHRRGRLGYFQGIVGVLWRPERNRLDPFSGPWMAERTLHGHRREMHERWSHRARRRFQPNGIRIRRRTSAGIIPRRYRVV